jgi:hypothetical protein
MKENAVAPSTPLPPAVASLDLSELDQEMSSVSDCDETIKKLLTLRNEYMAHRGSRHGASGTFASLPVQERDQIATLLKRALDMLRKYRDRLGFPPLAWGQHEVQNFKTLSVLLRAGLQARQYPGSVVGECE